ncbi:MAG: PAS domain S-box protein [Candidatus Aegiribacteria sp.]|nr:PAS domain S-box protein [Candidatus Aegiribacteria sp.]
MAENPIQNNQKADMLDNAPVIIAIHNMNRNIIWANKAYQEATGLSLQEIEGKECHLIWGLDEPCRNCPVKKAIETGKPCKAELTPKNQKHWPDSQGSWLVKATPNRNENGDIIGAIEAVYDITEYKQTENVLQKSIEHFKLLIENTTDIIIMQDLTGKYLYYNSPAVYGFKQENLLGKTPYDFHTPEVAAQLMNRLSRTISTGLVVNEETKFDCQGEILWFLDQSSPVKDAMGRTIAVITISRNISDRKKVEETLRESEEQLHTLIDAMPGFICFKDGDGRWLKVNDAGIRIFQLEGMDYQGKTDSELAELNNRLQGAFLTCKESDSKAWNEKRLFMQEESIYQSDGTVRDYDVIKVPIFHSDGSRKGIVVIGYDITERKEAEKALRESEEKLRTILNSMPDIVLQLDTNLTILWANKATLEMKPDAIGQFCYKALPGRNSICPGCPIVKTLNTGKIERGIVHLQSMAGAGESYWDDVGVPIKDSQGKITTILKIARNVTEKKIAEEEIRKLSKVVETTPEAIVMTDMQGKLEYVNRGLLTLGGFEDDSLLIGESFFSFSNEEGVKQLKEIIIPTVLSEGKWRGEVPVRRKDTSIFPSEMVCSLIKDEENKPKYLLSQFLDITRRKNTEEKLRESEQNFRDMTNLLPQIVFEIDTDGNLNFVNKQAFVSFGYSQEDYEKGINVLQTLIPSDREKAKENILNSLHGKDVENTEYTALRKDESTFPIVIYSSAILKDNKPVGLRGIIVDITELKHAEEEKARIEDQYRQSQKMESVGRLAGGVAHDFNNMLGVILGYTEMLQSKISPDQPIYAALQEIHKAADRSANLTRQLLAFARRQTVSPKVLELNETVEGMLKMLLRLIGEDINLSWLPCTDLWPIMMDPAQVDQILANLCVNGRDAIAGVGKMTIETRNVLFKESHRREYPESIPGEYVLLAVSDDGCGMDKEILENLFEPFFTTKEVGRGTGLGLATVYGIVKQNNGFINVYSESGEGTTFNIYLPRYNGKAAQMQKEGPTEPLKYGHETILLVEDEPAILEMATTMLETQGYTVLPATMPSEAIRMAVKYESEIHLLMTDVVMPEMNGRNLAKGLLSNYPNIKCLFMSGYTANVIAHRRVLDEGVNFIQKPFTIHDLTSKVREVLDNE